MALKVRYKGKGRIHFSDTLVFDKPGQVAEVSLDIFRSIQKHLPALFDVIPDEEKKDPPVPKKAKDKPV